MPESEQYPQKYLGQNFGKESTNWKKVAMNKLNATRNGKPTYMGYKPLVTLFMDQEITSEDWGNVQRSTHCEIQNKGRFATFFIRSEINIQEEAEASGKFQIPPDTIAE